MPLVRGGNDDILEQWRRRRKVEEMRTRAASGEPVSLAAAQVVGAILARVVHVCVTVCAFYALNLRACFLLDVPLAFYVRSAQVS